MCLHFWRGAIVGLLVAMAMADAVAGALASAAIDIAGAIGFALFELGIHRAYRNRPDFVTMSPERYEL